MEKEFVISVSYLRERIRELYGQESVSVLPTVTIEATTLDDLYFKTILSCLKHGDLYKIDSGSFAGSNRIEFHHATLVVKNPTTRPLAPIPRPGIPVTTNDDKIEEYFQDYLMNGMLKANEHYKYASWICGMPEDIPSSHKSVPCGTRLNQLEWCRNHFIEDGFGTNHCYITVGCAEGLQRYDWSKESDAERGSTECLRGLDLKIKGNRLNLLAYFRSWDLIAGLPENLGGLTRLMEYIVDDINKRKKSNQPEISTGILYANSTGLHIYEHNLNLAALWTGINKTKENNSLH